MSHPDATLSTVSNPSSVNPASANQENLVEVTEAAATKAKAVLSQDPRFGGIRIAVLGGGCAGLQYDLKPEEQPGQDDLVLNFHGAPFFIHPMVLPYIKGIRIDYSDSLMEGGFKFINPNAASSCGCGASFGI